MNNREFIRAVFGDAMPWYTAFVHWPGNTKASKDAAWAGAALNSWPHALDNPASNSFVSIGSIRDPNGRKVTENFAALHAVILDDVGTKIDPAKITLHPSAIIQTSQRDGVPNCQYWYFLDAPCTDLATAKRLTDALVDGGYSDAGAKGVLRYARLPVGSNSKPEYGHPIPHELLHIDATTRYSVQELAQAFGLDLTPRESKNGASGSYSGSGTETAELVRLIVTGENFHDATRDLSAKMITGGCHGGFVLNHLRGLMHAAPDLDSPRWQERYSDLPELVGSAEEKYRRDKHAPPESERGPLVDLATIASATIPAPDHKIDRLLPAEGAVTLLGGHGGTGKSQLALWAAVCLATGRPFLGRAVKRCRVIFYSAEDGRTVLLHRLARLVAHLGIDPANLHGWLYVYDMTETDPVLYREDRRGAGPTERYCWLRERIEEHGAAALVIDNASDVFDASEISRPRVREFIRLISQLMKPRDGSALLLAHVDKSTAKAGGGSEGYSGSTAWNNSVRSRLFLSDKNGALTLEHQKANYGPKADPMLLRWQDGLLAESGGSEAADSLTAFAHLRAVLRLIHDFNTRGESVGTGVTGPGNTHQLLRGERGYPARLSRDAFYTLLRDAERTGLIEREEYRAPDRKHRVRWLLTTKGRVECQAYAPDLDGKAA